MKRREFMKNAAIVGASAKFADITSSGGKSSKLNDRKPSKSNRSNYSSKVKSISEKAARLHKEALVWDMTLPWRLAESINITNLHLKYECLERFINGGANLISLSLAED